MSSGPTVCESPLLRSTLAIQAALGVTCVLAAAIFAHTPSLQITVLDLCGCHFEDDGERQLRDRVKLLEPAVIVVMGALVGFIVASVMLPLLDFSSIGGRR